MTSVKQETQGEGFGPSIRQIATADEFNAFLQEESTVKIMVVYATWCGYCTKFKPVLAAAAPPGSIQQAEFPLFAALQDTVANAAKDEWFPAAVASGLCPPNTTLVPGGLPKFMIMSGTQQEWAAKNQVLKTHVGYQPLEEFLATMESAAPGILLTTGTFDYLGPDIKKEAEARSRVGGNPVCNNPNCPVHGKKAAPPPPCKDPNCKVHNPQPAIVCNNPNCPKHGKGATAQYSGGWEFRHPPKSGGGQASKLTEVLSVLVEEMRGSGVPWKTVEDPKCSVPELTFGTANKWTRFQGVNALHWAGGYAKGLRQATKKLVTAAQVPDPA